MQKNRYCTHYICSNSQTQCQSNFRTWKSSIKKENPRMHAEQFRLFLAVISRRASLRCWKVKAVYALIRICDLFNKNQVYHVNLGVFLPFSEPCEVTCDILPLTSFCQRSFHFPQIDLSYPVNQISPYPKFLHYLSFYYLFFNASL